MIALKSKRCRFSRVCLKTFVAGIAAIAFSVTARADTTIYADDFSGLSASNLNGTAPDTRPGIETWSAASNWKANGSTVSVNSSRNASLPFTPQAGKIYTLSMTVHLTAGDSDWFALGFTAINSTNVDFPGQGAAPWMLQRHDGRAQTFSVFGAAGSDFIDTTSGPTNLKIVLNTTAANWTVEFFRNSLSLGSKFTYTTNPAINHVGFGSYRLAAGTVGNFSLVTASAPQAQIAIASYTVDGGGGQSSGGSFVLTGTIGQPDASSPSTGGSFGLSGGFWAGGFSPPSGYAAWAASHIAQGLDASFEGDSNGDGFPNGLVYVLGGERLEVLAAGVLTAPPEILPADVNLILETSTTLEGGSWTSLLEYTAGVQTFIGSGVTINNLAGTVTHAGGPNAFYRYRAVLLP